MNLQRSSGSEPLIPLRVTAAVWSCCCDAPLNDQVCRRIRTTWLEIDRLVTHRRVEKAVGNDDLLDCTLDAQPRSLVGLKQAALDSVDFFDIFPQRPEIFQADAHRHRSTRAGCRLRWSGLLSHLQPRCHAAAQPFQAGEGGTKPCRFPSITRSLKMTRWQLFLRFNSCQSCPFAKFSSSNFTIQFRPRP